MPSKFFWGSLLFGGVLWFVTKDFKAGLLPIFVYVFIRVLVNLMLLITERQNKI